MPQIEPVDGKYYEVARPHTLAERLTIAARERIHAEFLRLCAPAPADTILDVGVSDVITDAANALERSYPYPERITAVGLGEGGAFRTAHPRVRYVQVEPDRPLPFPADSFAIATSNAVLEHVGSLEAQGRFVRELLRVAERVYICVPHRFHPVEHHTGIPLLHFWDGPFRLACRCLGKADWAVPANLILMSRRNLAALVPPGVSARIGRTGLPLGPFSSNLSLFIDRRQVRP